MRAEQTTQARSVQFKFSWFWVDILTNLISLKSVEGTKMNESRFGLKRTKLTIVFGKNARTESGRLRNSDLCNENNVYVCGTFEIDIQFHDPFEGLFLFYFLPPMNYILTMAFTSPKNSIPVRNVFHL